MANDRDTDIFDTASDAFDTESGVFSPDTDIESLLSDLDVSLSDHSEDNLLDDLSVLLNENESNNSSVETEKAVKKKTAKQKKVKVRAPEPELTGLAASVAKHHKPINITLGLVSLGLIAAIFWVIFSQMVADPFGNTILPNVSVAGVPVGGLNKSDATQAVSKGMPTGYLTNNMVIVMGNQEITLPTSIVKTTPDTKLAVEKAYALGRTGTAAERQKAFQLAKSGNVTVDISDLLGLDQAAILQAVSDAAQQIESEYIPSGYTLDGEAPMLDSDNFDPDFPCQILNLAVGAPGSGTNVDAILSSVMEAYSNGQFRVEVPQEYLPKMPDKLDIDAIYKKLNIAPVEASSETASGSCGYTFSLDYAREALGKARYGETVSIPMNYVVPAVLEWNGDFTETYAAYETPISGLMNYDQNMKLFCEALDGTIIQGGEIFSLNAAVPVRNESTGYKPAVKHAGYCLTEHAAGGVDQVASTLYASALKAGLRVTEKHYADHICAYTIAGTELTVESSWQDLKIQNTFQSPVKIRAKMNNKSIVIRILGQQPINYYFELESESSRKNNPGVVYVRQDSTSVYSNNDVILEGTPGESCKLSIIKFDTQTKQEISREAQYADLASASKYIASK